MGDINLGTIHPVYKGTYDANTAYEFLNRVDDGNGKTYEAKSAVPAGSDLTDAGLWQLVFDATKVSRDELRLKETGFKNFAINGCFRVWQRGTSQTAVGYGSADRWSLIHNVSGVSIERSATVPTGATYSMKITNNSDTNIVVRQLVEGFYKVANSRAVSLSAMVKCVKGSVTIDVCDRGNKTTTSSNWITLETSFTSTLNSAYAPNGWIDIEVSAGAEIYITNIQLEISSVATPFEYRPLGIELSLCHRYFFKSNQDLYLRMYRTGGYKGIQMIRETEMYRVPTEVFNIPDGTEHFNAGNQHQIHIGVKDLQDTSHSLINGYTADAEL